MKQENKETHSIIEIEKLMYDLNQRISVAETKEEKRELRKKLKTLEKHWNSVCEKHINGKKYAVRKTPKDISKKELLALIDSIDVPDEARYCYLDYSGLDLSGISPNKNRFEFVEKGW